MTTPTEAIANTPSIVTLGDRQYEIASPVRKTARELRAKLADLMRTAGDAKADPSVAAVAMIERIDDFVDALRFVPSIGADWDYVENNATDEQCMEALQVLLAKLMAPLSKMGKAAESAIAT